ncbi:MAG TPA: class I SAM-dependent methyltransferase [Chthoniobacteraceae bacterium]|nr:class I SAM-dependent methyltransferase [Chthoniobacteraceae bacterium]
MSSSYFHRDNCRLCGSRNVELVIPFKPSAIADDYVHADRLNEKQEAYPMDLYLCNDCKHTQLLDVVNPALLFRNYTYVTSVSLGLIDHFRKVSEKLISRFSPGPQSLVVEIGSNDGTLLRFFKEKGVKVLGIDPATEIARKTTESGIETIPDFFTSKIATEILKTHGHASIFIANNVFAHADNLGDITDGIRMLLAPDGVFVFEVSYMVDIVDKMIWDTIFHEHLCFHAIHPFVNFFRLHGMELFDVERIPTKGGSIRGYAQLAGGPRKVEPIVGELLALEDKIAFGKPETFRAYGDRINATKTALLDLLAKLRSQGKTVAGYGASATVTTLLHHFELGGKLDFIVDDNPVKQGTYSPGQHIPVLPPSALAERKPDYVVILAWIYAEPIMKKNQAYIDQGGHFIIPNPEVKVI